MSAKYLGASTARTVQTRLEALTTGGAEAAALEGPVALPGETARGRAFPSSWGEAGKRSWASARLLPSPHVSAPTVIVVSRNARTTANKSRFHRVIAFIVTDSLGDNVQDTFSFPHLQDGRR